MFMNHLGCVVVETIGGGETNEAFFIDEKKTERGIRRMCESAWACVPLRVTNNNS